MELHVRHCFFRTKHLDEIPMESTSMGVLNTGGKILDFDQYLAISRKFGYSDYSGTQK